MGPVKSPSVRMLHTLRRLGAAVFLTQSMEEDIESVIDPMRSVTPGLM